MKTDRERIAMGECVSPLTVDRCPYCIDNCDASHWNNNLNESLEEANIDKPEQDHIHVKLPSGAIANVSPDCSEETLKALDELAKAALKKFGNNKE